VAEHCQADNTEFYKKFFGLARNVLGIYSKNSLDNGMEKMV
jgi:hypothetical protein